MKKELNLELAKATKLEVRKQFGVCGLHNTKSCGNKDS